MKPAYLTEENINAFITAALAEDIGEGDHSSLAAVPAEAQSRARLLIKAEGMLAGVELASRIFRAVDASLQVDVHLPDASAIQPGNIALVVAGPARAILSAERLALNCLQRMSGIATYTHRLQSLIQHTKAKLLDTRKTTPNFRLPEKWAVAIGGGTNHRYALYDMVMLKDNHIDFGGGIRTTVEKTRQYLRNHHKDLKIEVETRNLDEVQQVLDVGGVDVIMLDNMTPDEMKQAVALVNAASTVKQCETEASGNINEDTIVAAAESGVDFVSVGALTHSVQSLDMSLKAF
jgi:nicotinate-nucleotide pyrophosphorylase (carboxylating)